MPLRIPLHAHHPDAPRPPRSRRVHCPRCRGPFDISRRAITVRCPACGQPLAFDDLTVRRAVSGSVTTMGRVTLAPSARMHGELIAGSADVAGTFDGSLTAYARVKLASGSVTRGTITARSLDIRTGAAAAAHVRIGPDPTPPPLARPRRLLPADPSPHASRTGLPTVRPLR